MTPQVNYTEVNAGWSLYPVAYLPGQSTFEMQITSGKFEADLFVMANATKFEDLKAKQNGFYHMSATERKRIENSNTTVMLAHTPVNYDTISIAYPDDDVESPGRMSPVDADDPEQGYFYAYESNNKTYIKFNATDVANVEEVVISYYYDLVPEINVSRKEAIEESRIDNRHSAIGEAIMVWPVYGSGGDCTDSSIIGNVILKVFRCRVTAAPGFDSSYKQANTLICRVA